ncbi:MAG: trypsin-like serine protease, partial [Actinobacteria bacterium]|nr:trypsin-like serine protease [Actinomycetota bacterium]
SLPGSTAGSHNYFRSPGFPRPEFVDAVSAEHALSDLEDTVARITRDLRADALQGLGISTVGVDVPSNRVEVAVTHLDGDIVAALEDRYGADKLIVVEQPEVHAATCTRTSCAPDYPIRGGLLMYFPRENGTTGVCTIAFSARRGAEPGFLSAGHCADSDSIVGHNGYLIGTVRAREFRFNGNQDSEWMVQHAALPHLPSRWIWQTESETTYPITSVEEESAGNVGDPICHSGWRRGYGCGSIVSTSVTVFIKDGPTLADMKSDNICTGPGDSGGPVYASNRAHGIISATNSHINDDGSYRCDDVPRTYYSGIYNVESALGVTVQTWTY